MPEDRAPCRDFERGVCTRGDNCKYFHPEGATPAEGAKLPICKDFQNQGCDRFKCKFLHITQEEEVVYKTTGVLPVHGGRAENMSRPVFPGNDVCKDFMNGKCDRGSRCKYMHLPDANGQMDEMYGKRSRMGGLYGGVNDAGMVEENEVLRCKITDLQNEIRSLRQMNDTLYDQNARYRSQLQKGNITALGGPYDTVYPQYSQVTYPTISPSIPTSAAALSAYSTRPF